MKPRVLALLLPLVLAGCSDRSTTEPALEQRVFNLLGGLDVGEVLKGAGRSAASVYLTGGREGSRYIYIPFWATSSEGTQVLNVKVSGSNLAASRAGANPSRAPVARFGLQEPSAPYLDWSYHDALRSREQALRPLLPTARAQRDLLMRPSRAAAPPNVGDVLRLNVNSAQGCSNPRFQGARVVAVTNRAIVAVDTTNPPNNFTQADYQSVATSFDNLVYRVDTGAFGEPADIDNNGRVILFYTRAVNELTPPNSRGYVGGFFFVRDLLPRSASQGLPACAGSNVGEVFYLLAPDPTGVVNGNKFGETLVRRSTVGVTGHEFEHLINASRRIYINDANDLEEPWLDEGLAHIAEELLFYAESGLQPRQNIGLDKVRSSQQIVDAFNAFMSGNLGRYWTYLENPSAESLMGVDTELETRGAIWSFLRYAADQKAVNEPLFRQLVNSKASGLTNLRQVLGTDPVDLMQNWTVSVYADDLSGVPVADIYKQPSWDFRSLLTFLNDGSFPLKIVTLGADQATTVALKGGGSAFIAINPAATRNAAIEIKANASQPPDSLRISVFRGK